MGGGNGCKAAHKREKAQAKMRNKGGNSQLKANAKAQTIKCKICLTTFITTSNVKSLTEHWESKHHKLPFANCFPDHA